MLSRYTVIYDEITRIIMIENNFLLKNYILYIYINIETKHFFVTDSDWRAKGAMKKTAMNRFLLG